MFDNNRPTGNVYIKFHKKNCIFILARLSYPFSFIIIIFACEVNHSIFRFHGRNSS